MRGLVVFRLGLGLTASLAFSRWRTPRGERPCGRRYAWKLAAYARVFCLGVVFILARGYAEWGGFWRAVGWTLAVVSVWGAAVSLRLSLKGVAEKSRPAPGFGRRAAETAGDILLIAAWVYAWRGFFV